MKDQGIDAKLSLRMLVDAAYGEAGNAKAAERTERLWKHVQEGEPLSAEEKAAYGEVCERFHDAEAKILERFDQVANARSYDDNDKRWGLSPAEVAKAKTELRDVWEGTRGNAKPQREWFHDWGQDLIGTTEKLMAAMDAEHAAHMQRMAYRKALEEIAFMLGMPGEPDLAEVPGEVRRQLATDDSSPEDKAGGDLIWADLQRARDACLVTRDSQSGPNKRALALILTSIETAMALLPAYGFIEPRPLP